jgi:hypothetical protein
MFSAFCSLYSSVGRRNNSKQQINDELLGINLAAVTDLRFSNTATSPSRNRLFIKILE